MEKIILEYFQRNTGLFDLFPQFQKFPIQIREETEKEHRKLLETFPKKELDNGKIVFTVTREGIGSHLNFVNKRESYLLAEDMVPQSIIVALVSQFDFFVSNSIRYIFENNSERLNEIQRNLTYSEINSLGDIDKIKEFLIEKEIESVLRDNHFKQICWFEKKLSVSLQADKQLISDFIEITERRNLFVHADGVVSQQYLKTCTEHGSLCESVETGNKLKVDMDYFNHAADRLMEIGCKLGQIIWRKIDDSNRIEANKSLINITYELIKAKRYKVAAKVLEFFIEHRSRLIQDSSREYRAIINAAQCYKWLGEEEKCKSFLEMEDWKTKNDEFLLASLVLTDDFQKAAEIMKRMGSKRETIDKGSYLDWPLFCDFRNSIEFRQAYKEIYKEDYNPPEMNYNLE